MYTPVIGVVSVFVKVRVLCFLFFPCWMWWEMCCLPCDGIDDDDRGVPLTFQLSGILHAYCATIEGRGAIDVAVFYSLYACLISGPEVVLSLFISPWIAVCAGLVAPPLLPLFFSFLHACLVIDLQVSVCLFLFYADLLPLTSCLSFSASVWACFTKFLMTSPSSWFL